MEMEISFPEGLSPRVRGNQVGKPANVRRRGSIPACAGEPRSADVPDVINGVYPRVCGGTLLMLDSEDMEKGLSPRVRGNLRRGRRMRAGSGSIPACAGEP